MQLKRSSWALAPVFCVVLLGCGSPGGADHEGTVAIDEEDYASFDNQFSWPLSHTVTWQINDLGALDITVPAGSTAFNEVKKAVTNATNTWNAACALNFKQDFNADIQISFGTTSKPNYLASTGNTTHDILVDVTNHKWSTASSTPSDRYDLEQVMVHELGHAIGLSHSSARKARMYPFIKDGSVPQRQLSLDDKVSVSIIYDLWANDTSFTNARDVGTGSDGSVWITASDETILKRSGTSWVPTECCGNRIAVSSDGRPWIVAVNGTIWHRLSASTAPADWVQYNGCAADIAAGSPSNVYVLGCDDADGLGNHSIFKLNGTGFSAIPQGGAGTRLSVASNGDLWVVNSLGALWSLDHAALTWTQWLDSGVVDVGAGPIADQDAGLPQINYPFITKTDGRIWTLNSQSGLMAEGDDPDSAPNVFKWWRMADAQARGTSIAVTSSGVPWTIGVSGDGIHHPTR